MISLPAVVVVVVSRGLAQAEGRGAKAVRSSRRRATDWQERRRRRLGLVGGRTVAIVQQLQKAIVLRAES
jgi:hypothetical protein